MNRMDAKLRQFRQVRSICPTRTQPWRCIEPSGEYLKLTGGQVVAHALKEYGVEYVAGVPGHGIWALFDAFLQDGSEIPFIQVMHEQSAVHMADGYFRASGKPMACSTSSA